MKKILHLMLGLGLMFLFMTPVQINISNAYADTAKTYYTIYEDESKQKVLFFKGDDVSEGDMYLSSDNKLYEIESVDENTKVGIAKFIRDEELPKYNVSRKIQDDSESKSASAASTKKVGIYHTHNDESYYTPDGVDSVYGAGGIHQAGEGI